MQTRRISLLAPVVMTAAVLASSSGSSPSQSSRSTTDQKKPNMEKKEAAGHKPGHWSYEENETGPSNWGDLSDANILAEIGTSQSPIDIRTKDAVKASAPELSLTPAEATLDVVNNGHTIQFNCPGGGTLKVAGETFTLLQFHYHAPSEHTINGKFKPVEIHFVHRSDAGDLAVIGIMLETGSKKNELFTEICNRLPAYPGDRITNEHATFTPYDLLPESTAYFNYPGSLTTPPCSEGVHWFVLKEPVVLSANQIKNFTDRYKGNNRPVQPLNARMVMVSDD